jgi:hypothetical protein
VKTIPAVASVVVAMVIRTVRSSETLPDRTSGFFCSSSLGMCISTQYIAQASKIAPTDRTSGANQKLTFRRSHVKRAVPLLFACVFIRRLYVSDSGSGWEYEHATASNHGNAISRVQARPMFLHPARCSLLQCHNQAHLELRNTLREKMVHCSHEPVLCKLETI